jgi:hypothetical protein
VDAGGLLALGVAVRLGCGAALGFGAPVGWGCGDGDGLGSSGLMVGGWPGFSRAPPSSKRHPMEPPSGTERPPTPMVAYIQVEDFPSDQNRAQ